MTELSEILIQVSIETLKVQQLYCRHVLNVPAGGRAIVTNGRILGPLEQTEKFTLDDFSLLERFSLNSYGDKILQTFKKTADSDDGNAHLFLFVASEFLTFSGKEWKNARLLVCKTFFNQQVGNCVRFLKFGLLCLNTTLRVCTHQNTHMALVLKCSNT